MGRILHYRRNTVDMSSLKEAAHRTKACRSRLLADFLLPQQAQAQLRRHVGGTVFSQLRHVRHRQRDPELRSRLDRRPDHPRTAPAKHLRVRLLEPSGLHRQRYPPDDRSSRPLGISAVGEAAHGMHDHHCVNPSRERPSPSLRIHRSKGLLPRQPHGCRHPRSHPGHAGCPVRVPLRLRPARQEQRLDLHQGRSAPALQHPLHLLQLGTPASAASSASSSSPTVPSTPSTMPSPNRPSATSAPTSRRWRRSQ